MTVHGTSFAKVFTVRSDMVCGANFTRSTEAVCSIILKTCNAASLIRVRFMVPITRITTFVITADGMNETCITGFAVETVMEWALTAFSVVTDASIFSAVSSQRIDKSVTLASHTGSWVFLIIAHFAELY